MSKRWPQKVLEHDFDTRVLDGYGSLLAINGFGTPEARINGFTLGEALHGSSALDDMEIPSTPNALVMVGTPVILHELRLVSVNFQPIMRDESGTIRTVSSMEVTITTVGGGGENTIANPVSFSQAFYPVYQASVSNLDEMFPGMNIRPPGRYLVVMPTSTLAAAETTFVWQNWLDLKKRKGYMMQVVSKRIIAQAVGDSTKDAIKQYIAQTYNDNSLPEIEFAMMIGDISGSVSMPTFEMDNPETPDPNNRKVGDNAYFTIVGTDYIPDVLHGRISVSGRDPLWVYLSKDYKYEVTPDNEDAHWFESASFVAGNYVDGTTPAYPVTPVWNMRWARERLMRDACITDADTFYYHNGSEAPGDHRAAIRNDIEAGVQCSLLSRLWCTTGVGSFLFTT